MALSTTWQRGRILAVQFNKLNAAGVAQTGATDAIVLVGDCVQSITVGRTVTTDAAIDDGCGAIPERKRTTARTISLALGSKFTPDMWTMLGEGSSMAVTVPAAAQVGWQEGGISTVSCPCSSSSAVSVSVWYEAWLCGTCIGVECEVFSSVALTLDEADQTTTKGQAPTYTLSGTYSVNTGFVRGPGNLLPSGLTLVGGRFRFLQDRTAVGAAGVITSTGTYSGVPIKMPVRLTSAAASSDTCSDCGTYAAGFLSGTAAVGGTLNGLAAVY